MHYAAVILSYRRPHQVPWVVESLLQQDCPPDEILIWHNAPSVMLKLKRHQTQLLIRQVESDCNDGCSVRHAAGLLTARHRVLFVDDDVVLVKRDVARRMIDCLHGCHVAGAVGRTLSDDPAVSRPYSAAIETWTPGTVDIAKGWLHACTRQALLDVLQIEAALPADVRGEDDICLSMAVRLAGHGRPMLAGIHPSDVERLKDTDGVGNDRRPDHAARRDRAVRHLLGIC